jgi:D-alanyl-D-alanine endopeptidase (penicillin-binding protein 7)
MFTALLTIVIALAAQADPLRNPAGGHQLARTTTQSQHVRGPSLQSTASMIVNQRTGAVLYAKNAEQQTCIASLTKLMTAMVTLDSNAPLAERITITGDDVDHLRNTASRLSVGTALTRRELLQLALMSSENRAAAALARSHPGGTAAFIAAMNRKAEALGMRHTEFHDATGLSNGNVSTAADLVKMVQGAYRYPLVRQLTTTWSYEVPVGKGRQPTKFQNTNRLIRNQMWNIGLSKTGYIQESGRCLVMQATIAGEPLIVVLLDSWGKLTPIGDANRIRAWLEQSRAG